MKVENNEPNSFKDLFEDIEIFIFKLLKYMAILAWMVGILALVSFALFLLDDPIEGHTKAGIYKVLLICIGVILLQFLLKKIWLNKPWHN